MDTLLFYQQRWLGHYAQTCYWPWMRKWQSWLDATDDWLCEGYHCLVLAWWL